MQIEKVIFFYLRRNSPFFLFAILFDSEIEVTAQLRVSPGEDGSGKVVFAVLAPKAWNLRDNATEPFPPGRAWGDLRHRGKHLPSGGPGTGEFRIPAPGHGTLNTFDAWPVSLTDTPCSFQNYRHRLDIFHPQKIPWIRKTQDRKSTRLNSSHSDRSRMPSSA